MWYVVYTKSRCEKKVHTLFLDNNFESYCPLQLVEKQWTDRIKKVDVPLFSSYVFVKGTKEELRNVRFISGVVNFVYWLGKPAEIKDSEISLIKDFLESNKKNSFEVDVLKTNDKVKIKSGAFKDNIGVVKKVLKNKTILFVESLGIQITVSLKTAKG